MEKELDKIIIKSLTINKQYDTKGKGIMFRTFIYLNDHQIKNFSAILNKQPKAKEKKITKSGTVGALGIGGEVSEESTFLEEEKTIETIYHEFESDLAKVKGNSFFDFTTDSDMYDVPNLTNNSIFKVKSFLEIPEEFDIMEMFEKHKQPILNGLQLTEPDATKADFLRAIFSNTSADIPVLLETGDTTTFGKLTSIFLKEDYTILEDYGDTEVTFLCKFEGIVNKENVTIYDPAKDFVRLNRKLRRLSGSSLPEEFIPIVVEGPVVKVEILAVYK